uniref:Uncharacterized protein n=1 Tax=Wuchereria bancrofti TaxID=6293 RepID=A0AAF5PKC5_WUCBA
MRNENDAQKIIQNIYQRLKQIDGNCERLDIFVSREPPHRRRTAKYKVDQLKFECHSLHSTVDNMHMRMTSKWRAFAELKGISFYLIHQCNFRFRLNDTTRVPIEDCELFFHDHLHSSHNAIDELISHGSVILEQTRSQGMGLRGIKHKVLNIGHAVNWIIFCVGCMTFIVSMLFFYRFWKS